jgi:hypothetical protein
LVVPQSGSKPPHSKTLRDFEGNQAIGARGAGKSYLAQPTDWAMTIF